MKTTCWIIVKASGSVKLTKNQPSVGVDEVAVYLTLNIPDSLFVKPKLTADITIPQEAVGSIEIDSQVTDNVAEAIEQATGLQMRITVEKPEDGE